MTSTVAYYASVIRVGMVGTPVAAFDDRGGHHCLPGACKPTFPISTLQGVS